MLLIDNGLEIERQRVIQSGVELVNHLAHGVRTLAAVFRQHAHDQHTQQLWNLSRRYELRNRLFLCPAQIEMGVVRWVT